MNPIYVEIPIFLTVAIWSTYVAWRLYSRANVKSFLLIPFSILLIIFSTTMPPFPRNSLRILSELSFCVAVILICTVERDKFKELHTQLTLVDWLLGRFPSKGTYEHKTMSRSERAVFIFLNLLLITIPIVDFYFFSRGIGKTWPLLLIGIASIVYTLFVHKGIGGD